MNNIFTCSSITTFHWRTTSGLEGELAQWKIIRAQFGNHSW